MQSLTLDHLRAFLELADHRSIQAAARASGRSRASYLRWLREVRDALDAPELLGRARGQRVGVLTAEGEELARRARVLLRTWDQWLVGTRDALAHSRAVRVGTLAGSFDLIADLLAELRNRHPEITLRVVELPDERLVDALDAGAVDLGFGTLPPGGPPPRLRFEALGSLPWVVVVPAAMARRFGREIRLRELDGVPLVVARSGPARERIESWFARHEPPLVLDAAFEVGSTPRVVEMVARGFGPALVSRFRVAFLPTGVVARPLVDAPAPLVAGVFTRRDASPTPPMRELIEAARKRFRLLSRSTVRR